MTPSLHHPKIAISPGTGGCFLLFIKNLTLVLNRFLYIRLIPPPGRSVGGGGGVIAREEQGRQSPLLQLFREPSRVIPGRVKTTAVILRQEGVPDPLLAPPRIAIGSGPGGALLDSR